MATRYSHKELASAFSDEFGKTYRNPTKMEKMDHTTEQSSAFAQEALVPRCSRSTLFVRIYEIVPN